MFRGTLPCDCGLEAFKEGPIHLIPGFGKRARATQGHEGIRIKTHLPEEIKDLSFVLRVP